MDESLEMKVEPEVIICHNNDDVELAFDPFEDTDIDFPVAIEEVEEIDDKFGEVDVRAQVRIVNINTDGTSDEDSEDHFPDPVDFHDSYSSDENYKLPPTNTEIGHEKTNLNKESKLIEQTETDDADVAVSSDNYSDSVSATKKHVKGKDQQPKVKRKKGRPKSEQEHKCSVCSKLFPFESSLRVHERTHMQDKGHNCTICKKSFARADHCKHHMNTVHKGQIVDGVLRMPTFEQKCKICQKVFNHAGNLRTHLKLHVGERSHKCEQCGKTFVLAQHLKSHIQIVHLHEKTFQCSICGKLFNHSGNYRKHMKIHDGIKPFKCSICEKRFAQSSNYQNHMKVHSNDRPHKCDQCYRSFIQPNNLILHQRVHSGEKPFECEICERRFRLKSQCDSHMRVHTGQKPYSCLECGNAYSSKFLLRKHEKMHSGNPLPCTYCEKTFMLSHQLVAHTRTHTGEKPYVCQLCDAAFVTAAQRNRHIKMRHETADKPKVVKDFPCDECGRIFHDKRLLSNHIKIHEGIRPFKCEYCSKGFITKSDCKKHERVHTGLKPYTCDFANCGRQFTFSNSYRIHMRNHLGEKPFKCSICDKAFSCSSDRGKHVRSHNASNHQ